MRGMTPLTSRKYHTKIYISIINTYVQYLTVKLLHSETLYIDVYNISISILSAISLKLLNYQQYYVVLCFTTFPLLPGNVKR